MKVAGNWTSKKGLADVAAAKQRSESLFLLSLGSALPKAAKKTVVSGEQVSLSLTPCRHHERPDAGGVARACLGLILCKTAY